MVKIEHLKNGAKATFMRNDKKIPVFLHMLISRQELETLEVETGTVVYSVDELEILEKSAPAPAPAPAPAERKLTAKEIARAAKLAQAQAQEDNG